MEPRIQYTKTEDGISIAYLVDGEGPAVVLMPFFIESFSLDNVLTGRETFIRSLARGRTLVRYDGRGTGLSQRDAQDFSIRAMAVDLEAVVQATGLKRFSLFGGVYGSLVAITYAAGHEREVQHLILYEPDSRLISNERVSEEFLRGFAEVARTKWSMASQTLADQPGRREVPEATAQLADCWFRSSSGETVARIILENLNANVTPLLPRLRMPTLIFAHPQRDADIFSIRREIALQLPSAQFVPLPGTHMVMELEEDIPREIDRFLGDNTDVPRKQPGASDVHTILFTDIESSTALRRKLGDAQAQELLRAHNEIVRTALGDHHGREIKHTGDGIMASFGTASSAVQCGIAIQRGVAAHVEEHPDAPLGVYVGLNAGEPIAEDGPDGRADLFGTSVDLARRICDHAEPGQILVSNVVRELAEGKGFLFSDIGDVVPKGFEQPVRLYEVRWREEG